MRKALLGMLVIAVIVGLMGCSQPPRPAAQEGRVVFTMTDAAANMGSVSSVRVTIDDVQMHSAADGWVSVSSGTKTYDLLQLKAQGTQALLADTTVKPGTYEQVRLHISNVVVTDASGDHVAKLPSGDLKIVGNIVVEQNATSSATFDFIADESLHVTGNGQYIMAPVVQLETRKDVDVDARSSTNVLVRGGRTTSSVKVGMDASGNVGTGLGIGKNTVLTISGNTINIGIATATNTTVVSNVSTAGKGRTLIAITDAAANLSSVTSIKVTVNEVEVHSASEGWITASAAPKTYDLLELNASGAEAILADIRLEPGTYQQIRLLIDNIMVIDEDGAHAATLPSGELKLVAPLVVNANGTSVATVDFIAGESLHVTGNGQYVFAPVIHYTTRENANLSVAGGSMVRVSGGNIRANVRMGMDNNGNFGMGTSINKGSKLIIIDGDVRIGN